MNKKVEEIMETLLRMEKPEILITSEIDGSAYRTLASALLVLKARGSPDVVINIDSGGGEVGAGLDMYDLIRLYPGETTGMVYGRAASMAAIVLQACKKRHAARHAEILIHHVSRQSVSLDTLKDKEKLDKLVADLEARQKRLYQILCEKTKKSEGEIAAECAKDAFMPAEVAKDFGLLDEVL